MQHYIKPISNLIYQLAKLPGVGGKTAQRLAFHIIGMDQKDVDELAKAISAAKREIRYCSVCGGITDRDPCSICSGSRRENSTICVVEDSRDMVAMERTREYKGLYHVLNGTISPMDGIGPDEINIKSLLTRLGQSTIQEVILATNPTIEGEATAVYIARLIKALGIKVTRIAHGIPIGGELEHTDEVTLMRALEGRREM